MLMSAAVAILAIANCSCSSEEEEAAIVDKIREERKEIALSADTRSAATELKDFYVNFTTDMVKYVDSSSAYKSKNVVVSPVSMSMVLAMIANGVDKNSSEKIISGYLGVKDNKALNELCGNLLVELPKSDNLATMAMSNSLWVNQAMELRLSDEYLAEVEKTYNLENYSADFTNDNEKAKNEINAWASGTTNGRIPNYLKELYKDAFVIVLNAFYFNAPWDGKLFMA